MSKQFSDIYYSEIPSLIRKLIGFLGEAEVKRHLDRYEAALRDAGPFFRKYYLEIRNPWSAALTQYINLEKKGLTIQKHLTKDILRLVADAKKINFLQKRMPEEVKEKFRKDLLDDEAAYAYLFELNIAWHFAIRKYDLKWLKSDTGRHSEFIVKAPDLEFEVECKRITADASRKIRRRDFYRFVEKLIRKIEPLECFGNIDILIEDRLHSNEQSIDKLVNSIIAILNAGNKRGEFGTDFGCLGLNLKRNDGASIDFQNSHKNLMERKPSHAHGAIYARSRAGAPVNPIEITLSSLKSDDYINGIRKKISDAAKNQLSGTIPGIVAVFLEDVDDLIGLERSNLQTLSYNLFLKEDLSHLAAIVFSSESIFGESETDETLFNRALSFRNPSCKYDKFKSFPLLN